MEHTSPGDPCDRVDGEPTSHASPIRLIRTLGDDPGAESVIRSITEFLRVDSAARVPVQFPFRRRRWDKMSDLQTVCQKLRGQCRSQGQGGQLGVRGASRGKRGSELRRTLGSDTQLHYPLDWC